MQYDPKLKNAMEEIKAVLKKHDIAGVIVLQSPGFCEFLNHINPSYSCLYFDRLPDGTDGIRFKTKGRSEQDITNSANMVMHFSQRLPALSVVYMDMWEALEKQLGAHSAGGGGTTSDSQQNN